MSKKREYANHKWEPLVPRRVDGMGEECTVGSYVALEFRSVHGGDTVTVIVSKGAAEQFADEIVCVIDE